MSTPGTFDPGTIRGQAEVTPEHALSAALQAMREQFAAIDDNESGDYWERWSKHLLEQRPLLLFAVLHSGSCTLWVMDRSEDAALACDSTFLLRTDDTIAAGHRVETESNAGYVFHSIREKLAWLDKELSGELLTEQNV
jgi:hypothetical protein